MKTTNQVILDHAKDIEKRAYRDYTMGQMEEKNLSKVLLAVKNMKKAYDELEKNKTKKTNAI
jgi:hypothetical protein